MKKLKDERWEGVIRILKMYKSTKISKEGEKISI